jgi:hypothetical protein
MARPPARFPQYFADVSERVLEMKVNRQDSAATPVTIEPRPAPWLGDRWVTLVPDDAVTMEVEITANPADLLAPDAIKLVPDPGLAELWLDPPDEDRRVELSADVIAVYRPWHQHGEDWGIYFNDVALTVFAAELARLTGTEIGRLAPLVVRQVLEHECTHFAFEVAGTEISDALSQNVYPDYVKRRFNAATTPIGPLEEVVASWAEVQFARNPPRGFRSLRPRGYAFAVQYLLDLAPDGYRDWREMETHPVEIVSGIATLIADRDMSTYRWGVVTDEERAQVPVYFVGDPKRMRAFGALPKTIGPPTIKRFVKWLRLIGATELPDRRGRGATNAGIYPTGCRSDM